MSASSSTSSSDPVRAWALALGAIVLIEALVAVAAPATPPVDQGARLYLAGRTPTFDESVLQWQLDRLRSIDAPAELLVVGDSSALIGLVPAVLQEATGMRTESVATIAHLGVDGQADVLSEYLARLPQGAPGPRLVLAQLGDWSLVTSDDDAERIGMRAAVRTWLGRSEAPVARWPSHRLRTAARVLVGGGWHQPGPKDDEVRHRLRRDRGHLPDPTPTLDWAAVERPQPGVHPDSAQGLARLARICKDAGAALLLAHPPTPDRFDTPDLRARYARMADGLRTLLGRLGHGRLLEPFVQVRPLAEFSSVDHLTAAGAERHSRNVAAAVVRDRGAW